VYTKKNGGKMTIKFENIPIELKKIPRWVLWKYTEVGEGATKRLSKLPIQASGKAASSTNSATWTDFVTVQHTYQLHPEKFSGIGFVFSEEDGR
jgi:putative DNA primase/helicase